jgi:hypothetical protein
VLILAQAEVEAEAIRTGQKILVPDGTLSNPPGARVVALLPTTAAEPLLLQNIEQIAEQNIRVEAIRREISLTKAVLHAEDELAQDDSEPSPTGLSDDWLIRWRDSAAGVSSEELQSLWGKVLAGEVKKPGRYSLRTLDFLRNLSQDDAKAIESLSAFVVDNDVIWSGSPSILESAGVTFPLLLSMEAIGVVRGVETQMLEGTWSSVYQDRFEYALVCHGRVLIVRQPEPARKLKVKTYRLTALGKEVLQLGSFVANDSYLRALGSQIKILGFEVGIADSVRAEDGGAIWSNLEAL